MTPDTWCLEKREILTVLELDGIRRGSYISRDDSIGEVRFIIRDLENFWILTEITILPFFIKFEFSQVLQKLSMTQSSVRISFSKPKRGQEK